MIPSRDFHVFSKDGKYYLFLTQPVAIFKVDRVTGNILERMERHEPLDDEESQKRQREVEAFIADYCANARQPAVLRSQKDITDKVHGLYLFVSQECNLKCTYCYGHEGEYGQRGRMNEATLHSTFYTFFADDADRHFITFFGGEPLMNLPIMQKAATLKEQFRREGRADLSLGIVTNGTLYDDEIGAYFRDHIDAATFSLDGPADLNDRQRPAKRDRNVYETVTNNIRRLTAEGNFNWAFRSIVTRAGHDRVENIYDDLARYQPGGIGIVNVDVPEDSPLYLNDGHYRHFIEQIVNVNRKGLHSFVDGEQPVAFEYPFYVLFYFVTRSHTLYHCNAGTNLLAVTAEGDIYPCHRFVGDKDFHMGNVADPNVRQSERYQEIRRTFAATTVDQRPGCEDCWARYLCGGSCVKYSHAQHGSMLPPVARHCQYIKTVIEEILPDILELVQVPETRQRLTTRLRAAISANRDSRSMDIRDVA